MDLFHDAWDDNNQKNFVDERICIIHDCCTSIGAIIGCKMVSQKKVTNDETNVEGRWNVVALANILGLYEKKWRHIDEFYLTFKHWTHILIEYHHQLLDECCCEEEQIEKKIEKMKSEY